MIAICGRCERSLPIAARQFLDPRDEELAGLIHLQIGADYCPITDPVSSLLEARYEGVIDLCVVCSAFYLEQIARTITFAVLASREASELQLAGGAR